MRFAGDTRGELGVTVSRVSSDPADDRVMAERLLRMTYDLDADAAYIYLTDPIGPGEVDRTTVLGHRFDCASVNVDLDVQNRVLGIELLGVSRLLRPEAIPPTGP